MPAVHDIPRHPKTAQFASGKVEFRAITMRDDNGQTIITSGISAAKFTNNGDGFTIDLPEGLLESRVRITGGTITEWEDGRFVNPPGGGRYLTLLQSFTGVPEDPSALEALYAVLNGMYAQVIQSDTPPSSPAVGDLWMDTSA